MFLEGKTLVPILRTSDKTHLTNFSGDKKLWPVYMSIGNIQSSIPNTFTIYAWIPIALLPIRPKRVNTILAYLVEKQEIQPLQTVHDVIRHLLRSLSDAACQKGYEMACADGNIRLCFPKLHYWLADHMENATIHGIANNHYSTCMIPTNKLGEYSEIGYTTHSQEDYTAAYTKSHAASLNN